MRKDKSKKRAKMKRQTKAVHLVSLQLKWALIGSLGGPEQLQQFILNLLAASQFQPEIYSESGRC